MKFSYNCSQATLSCLCSLSPEFLKVRSHDPEEAIRHDVIVSIVTAAKKDLSLVNDALLNFVKERTLDKRVSEQMLWKLGKIKAASKYHRCMLSILKYSIGFIWYYETLFVAGLINLIFCGFVSGVFARRRWWAWRRYTGSTRCREKEGGRPLNRSLGSKTSCSIFTTRTALMTGLWACLPPCYIFTDKMKHLMHGGKCLQGVAVKPGPWKMLITLQFLKSVALYLLLCASS